MKKIVFSVLLMLVLLTFSNKKALAIYDPTQIPNNRVGIHILFPGELAKAKDLIDSSGGDWGYVTIPIQAGDKDIKKWQTFMDQCRQMHIIPIVRLATSGNYFNTATWSAPSNNDVIDFANFLNSIRWPTKNRYIVVFNEVNRADEWQGQADPTAYANILSYAVSVFKSKSPDYFVISAGMDNAARSDGKTYDEYSYYASMNQAVPGIFNQIDGLGSHSYPNPGFSKPPSVKTNESIASFSYEEQTIDALTTKKLPVFITETGWDQSAIGSNTVGNYYKDAFTNVWNDPRIIAVTPFLLKSGPGPFQKFTLMDMNDDPNYAYRAIQGLQKTAGKPLLYPNKKVLGVSVPIPTLPTENFPNPDGNPEGKAIKSMTKWFFFGL